MTPAARRALQLLADMESAGGEDEDGYAAEIAVDGLRSAWIGLQRFRHSTVDQLLRALAIREISEQGERGMRRYAISETGHAILRRPALEAEIHEALLASHSFMVKDDRIVPMEP